MSIYSFHRERSLSFASLCESVFTFEFCSGVSGLAKKTAVLQELRHQKNLCKLSGLFKAYLDHCSMFFRWAQMQKINHLMNGWSIKMYTKNLHLILTG